MNVDDLIAVWRSQDDAPLHGVNETLLRLALRKDEVKEQELRRRARWVAWLIAAVVVTGMARRLSMMINDRNGNLLSGWDYAIPVLGAATALLWLRLVYARHRSQAAREQRFGDSLREQINRQIAQLDYGAMRARLASLLGTLLLPIVWAFLTILASWRINHRSFSDPWLSLPIVFMIGWSVVCVSGTYWWVNRSVQRTLLPRKRRLEALLKELEAP